MKLNNPVIKIGLGYILICLIWGSTWMFIRIGLDSLTPLVSAGLRFCLASILIFGLMKIRHIRLQLDKLSIRLYFLMGLFSFVIPFGLVYWAEQYIASGLASVLFAVFPFFVIIFSRFAFPKEASDLFKIFGVILGFCGIFFIFIDDISLDIDEDFWGMSAVLVSAIMQAGIAVTMKKYGKHLNPLSMNLIPLGIAGVILSILGFAFENTSRLIFDTKAIVSITYLALFGTLITFTTYYWLLKQINVVILSLSAFITPIIALFLGWLILNELFTLTDLTGSALVLLGILFANFKGFRSYYKTKKAGFS